MKYLYHTMFVFSSIFLLFSCTKNDNQIVKKQIGTWSVFESTIWMEDEVVSNSSEKEYELKLFLDGSGEEILNEGVVEIDWCLHNDDQHIVLLEVVGSGSDQFVITKSLQIEKNESNHQIWANHLTYFNNGVKVEKNEVFDLTRIE